MYLHVGKGRLIAKSSIIGIFDLDLTSQSHITRKYLSACEKAHQVINASEDIPKSFIVCEDRGERALYLSQLASSTLRGRSENNSDLY